MSTCESVAPASLSDGRGYRVTVAVSSSLKRSAVVVHCPFPGLSAENGQSRGRLGLGWRTRDSASRNRSIEEEALTPRRISTGERSRVVILSPGAWLLVNRSRISIQTWRERRRGEETGAEERREKKNCFQRNLKV